MHRSRDCNPGQDPSKISGGDSLPVYLTQAVALSSGGWSSVPGTVFQAWSSLLTPALLDIVDFCHCHPSGISASLPSHSEQLTQSCPEGRKWKENSGTVFSIPLDQSYQSMTLANLYHFH